MQILRLHWRSLMPWDRSPDNQLTQAQRRDYLMASVGWFRDLLMLIFSLLLLVISGLLAAHSGFAVAPMEGARSLLPLSLIMIATVCNMWTLGHWTTLSARRALRSLVISLSVTWVIALACVEGMARRDGVFLRTSKSAGRRRILGAFRLTWVETILAVVLYVCVGVLVSVRHGPWLLILIIGVQGTVYLCSPIAGIWNLWAQGVPAEERRRRFEKRRQRAARGRLAWARLSRPAVAAVAAVCVGAVTTAFLAPGSKLQETAARRGATPQSLLAGSANTQVYVQVGSSATAADGAYAAISSVRLSNLIAASPTSPPHFELSFDTSSIALLDAVLRAAVTGGRISSVSLALRTPGGNGQSKTELVDTFAVGSVASFTEHLAGIPGGRVTLVLPAVSQVISSPLQLRRLDLVTRFPSSSTTPVTTAYLNMANVAGPAGPGHALTGMAVSQAAPRAPIDLTFTTSSVSLLSGVFRDEDAGIPVLTVYLRAEVTGSPQATAMQDTFSGIRVTSFAENLSGSVFGTATLVIGPQPADSKG
jgi:hypothetical protein